MHDFLLKLQDLLGPAGAIDFRSVATLALQVVIILYAIIWTWGRIKGTQAERLFKGILVLTSICLLSWVLHLDLIKSLLQQIIPSAVLALVIIFQPEIRRGLGHLGKTTFRFDLSLADPDAQKSQQVIDHVISALHELSHERIGALVVIEPPEGERDYLSPGTTLNAEVSSHLIVSIFQPKSPLHDGAVIIRADKLVAAGVILPITDNPKLSYRYGTRHRAAIGLSEIYDGLCIVVSEETGAISAANRGMLVRYDSPEDLRDPLSYFYYESPVEQKAGTPLQSFLSLFSSKRSSQQPVFNDEPVVKRNTPQSLPTLPAEKTPNFVEDVRHAEQPASD